MRPQSAASDARKRAERVSFAVVPETCPDVDREFDLLIGIVSRSDADKVAINQLREFVKAKTTTLRALGIDYIEKYITNGPTLD